MSDVIENLLKSQCQTKSKDADECTYGSVPNPIEVETKMCVETCGTYFDGVITILSEEESAEIAKVSVSDIFNMMKLDASKKYEFKIEVEEYE